MLGDSDDKSPARRVDLGHEPNFGLGGLEVVPQRRLVRWDGAETVLEPRVMQFLVALHCAGGAVLSRDDVIESCWGGQPVGDDSINQIVSKLRKVSRQTGGGFEIETIRGVGYRLKVRAGAESKKRPTILGAASAWKPLAAGALAVALMTAGNFGPSMMQSRTPELPVSLAVLPFTDLSPQRNDAHLAEGVGEEILSLLAGDPNIKVMGRASAYTLKDKQPDLTAIRSSLGVTHFVEGSVRSAGDRVRISVRLIETEGGEQIWSRTYDRAFRDIFAVQEEIGASVAQQLRGTFAVPEDRPERSMRPSREVYELYLKANAISRVRSYDNYAEAERLLQRAVRLDPAYAPAHARLAYTLVVLHQLRPSTVGVAFADSISERSRAADFARRALALDPGLAEAHAVLGMTEENPEKAMVSLRRAIEIDPANYIAWNNLGIMQVAQCDYRDALISYRRAAAIEPLLMSAQTNSVSILARIGRHDEAEAIAHRFLAASGERGAFHKMLGLTAYLAGDLSAAVIHTRAARRLTNDAWSVAVLAYALQALGDTEEAVELLANEHRIVGLYWKDEIAAAAREAERAGSGFWGNALNGGPGAVALLRAGRGKRLIELFDSAFPSIASFDAKSECGVAAVTGPLTLAFRQAGRHGEAQRLLALSATILGKTTEDRAAFGLVDRAQLAMLQGNREAALASLEQAVRQGYVNQPEPNHADFGNPAFDPIRNEPRFRALRDKVDAALARERRELAMLNEELRPQLTRTSNGTAIAGR